MALVETRRDHRGVVTVTLADEANRNALSRGLLAELTAVLDRVDTDPSVRVVVLTNRGRVFCAGADLRESAGANAPGSEASENSGAGPSSEADTRADDGTDDRKDNGENEGADDRDTKSDGLSSGKSTGHGSSHYTVTARDVFGRFRRSPKPYVGRISGHCVAGGMGLAAAMDISVARDDAKFGFTEVRVGVAPAMISVLCLPKMRRAEATAAFLRGNRFTASEAARLGLINAAVPAERLDAEVEAVVVDLLAGAPAALAATKQLLERVPDLSFDEALDWAEQLSARLFASDDAAEGMDAYLNKRAPAWASPDQAQY